MYSDILAITPSDAAKIEIPSGLDINNVTGSIAIASRTLFPVLPDDELQSLSSKAQSRIESSPEFHSEEFFELYEKYKQSSALESVITLNRRDETWKHLGPLIFRHTLFLSDEINASFEEIVLT